MKRPWLGNYGSDFAAGNISIHNMRIINCICNVVSFGEHY